VVQLEPAVQHRVRWRPEEGGVVAVAHGEDAVGPQHAGCFAHGGDGIGQVLEDLMCMDHVERRIGDIERVHVADGELDPGLVQRPRLFDDLGRRVDAEHATGRDQRGELDGDRARTAPDVEQVQAGPKVWEQVAGRVLRRAPPMAAQHGVVVSVGVDVAHARSLAQNRPGTVPAYGVRGTAGVVE
jgi:hypothetical protein